LEQVSAGFVSSLFSNTVAIIALLVVLVWRPTGILARAGGQRVDVPEPHVRGGYSFTIKDFHAKVWRSSLVLGAVILLLPLFVHSEGMLNSLVITGIFFITTLGLDLLTGFAGQVSLGQAGFMAIGGYTSAVLAVKFHLAPLAGVAAGLVFSLAAATLLGLISARLRGMYLAMATLAFRVLVQSLALGLMGVTGGPSGLVGIPSFSIGRLDFTGIIPNYYLVWILVGVIFFLATNLVRSDWGRVLRSINTDHTMAQALGVNVTAHKIKVFLISAGLASLAGSLYSFYFHFLSPDMVSSQTSIDLLTMLILGGEGTLIGPLVGVILLTFMPTYFQPLALYKPLVEGLLLVIILLRLPGGILGGILDAHAWFIRPGPDRLPPEGGRKG
jgi:branched-chain amino acid transport system permease protein